MGQKDKKARELRDAITGLFMMAILACMLYACAFSRGGDSEEASPSQETKDPHETTEGDGLFYVAGMSGKNFGNWESDPAPGNCMWSVRAILVEGGNEVIDQGTAAAGERARVTILPDGEVSSTTGIIDDLYRLSLWTNGCGSWTWKGF